MTPLLRAAGPHRPLQSLKIAQGVSGTVRDKGAVKRNVPYLVQAVKQGFQVGLCVSVSHSFGRSVLQHTATRLKAWEYITCTTCTKPIVRLCERCMWVECESARSCPEPS